MVSPNPNPNPTTNSFHLVAAWLNYPIVIGSFIAASIYCINRGIDDSIWVPAVSISHFLIVIVLEQLIPRNPKMNLFRDKQSLNDIGFNIVIAAVRPIAGSVLVLMVAWLSEYRLGTELVSLWPSQWHFGFQVVLSILCITFMDYWQHRMFHTVDALWWFHVLHHNPSQMHVLKVARIHVLDGIVGALVIPLPLILFGAPKEIALMAGMWMLLLGRSVHANVDQRFPRWFHFVLPSVQVHNLHHSDIRKYQDSNFSTNLPLWDWLFGTLSHPHQCKLGALGIKDDYVPTSFIKQIYQPFVWCFRPPVAGNSGTSRS